MGFDHRLQISLDQGRQLEESLHSAGGIDFGLFSPTVRVSKLHWKSEIMPGSF